MMAFVRPFAGRGIYGCLRHDFTRTLSTTPFLSSAGKTNSHNESKQTHNTEAPPFPDKNKPLDDIKYFVEFKTFDVKKIFKEFYSVYGPLFVACHIGVSLVSLGFFCGLSWLVVDPLKLIPDFLVNLMTNTVLHSTATGSKFVVAYAVHKVILPIRFGAAVWATRKIATRVEYFRNRVAKAKKD